MMQADEVKKMVETCMKVHYGAGFQTVTKPDNVPCLGDAVADAYIDLDKNVRVTAFVNVAGADILMPDAVGTSIMSAKRGRGDKNRYIFIRNRSRKPLSLQLRDEWDGVACYPWFSMYFRTFSWLTLPMLETKYPSVHKVNYR